MKINDGRFNKSFLMKPSEFAQIVKPADEAPSFLRTMINRVLPEKKDLQEQNLTALRGKHKIEGWPKYIYLTRASRGIKREKLGEQEK